MSESQNTSRLNEKTAKSGDLLKRKEKLKREKTGGISCKNISLIINIILLTGCAMTPLLVDSIDFSIMKDVIYHGYYKGSLNSATVEVSIKTQRITDIVILEHETLVGKKAEDIIINAILEKQSTRVDAVSGATNSSHVIINAVQIALEKAYQE